MVWYPHRTLPLIWNYPFEKPSTPVKRGSSGCQSCLSISKAADTPLLLQVARARGASGKDAWGAIVDNTMNMGAKFFMVVTLLLSISCIGKGAGAGDEEGRQKICHRQLTRGKSQERVGTRSNISSSRTFGCAPPLNSLTGCLWDHVRLSTT